MINFFRRVRRRLLSENKVTRYLIYALGEILLVLVGILLALQVNNWNENKKEDTDLRDSLTEMIDELESDIDFLEREAGKYSAIIPKLELLIDGKYEQTDLDGFVGLFGGACDTKNFGIIYNSLKADRKLNLIRQKQVKEMIINYYENISEDHIYFSYWHDRFVADNIDSFILANIPLDKKGRIDPKIAKALLQQVKFQNILAYQLRLYSSYVSMNNRVIKDGVELRGALASYIHAEDD